MRWDQVREVFGDNGEMLSKLSIIEGDGDNKMVRMANLAIVGAFKVISYVRPYRCVDV